MKNIEKLVISAQRCGVDGGAPSVVERHSPTILGYCKGLLVVSLCLLVACSQSREPDWLSVESKIYNKFNLLCLDLASDSGLRLDGEQRLDGELRQVWEQGAFFRQLRAKGVLPAAPDRFAEVEGQRQAPDVAVAKVLPYVQFRLTQDIDAPISRRLARTALRASVLGLAADLQSNGDFDDVDANRFYSRLEGVDMVIRGYWQTESGQIEQFKPLIDGEGESALAVRDAIKLALSAAGLLNDVTETQIGISAVESKKALEQSLIILNDALAAVP